MYSLKSRCFLESTGIYHIPLLCFLHDKGFDCSVINPIITKNSTNSNIRKLHNDKFDSKRQQGLGLMLLLRLLSSLMTKSSTFGTWCATTITTKICSLLLSWNWMRNLRCPFPHTCRYSAKSRHWLPLNFLNHTPCYGHACRSKGRDCQNNQGNCTFWWKICPLQIWGHFYRCRRRRCFWTCTPK